jgi:hypothetical protein
MLLAGILAGALVGCTSAAELRDSFRKSDYRLSFERRLRLEGAAPIIILGRVLEVTEIGQPKRSRGDPRIKTQLTKIKVHAEVVVKGVIRSNPVEFYYFKYSPDSDLDLGVPRYLPAVGQTRLYFLKPAAGLYRTVGDVTDYSLPVRTGEHSEDFCRGKTPGSCIAEILLVPGSGFDTVSFLQDLVNSAYAAHVLCSPSVTRDLVKQLIDSPDRRVADRAREVLAIQ